MLNTAQPNPTVERISSRLIGVWTLVALGLTVNWIVADIVRMEDGLLVEHWDVIEDTPPSSKSGLLMFGDRFAG